MKKTVIFNLVILMVICCTSCSKQEEALEKSTAYEEIDPFIIEDDVVDSTEDYNVDFYETLENINNNKEFSNTPVDSSEFTHSFYETLDLVSEDEAKETMKQHPAAYSNKENLLKDVDLYFRLLKTYYGAYEYFGGDGAFEPALENIVKEINEYEGVFNKEVYRDIVIRNLDFMVDGHAQFADKEFLEHNNLFYKDYYLDDYYFYEDDNGFYTKINNHKWYLKSVMGSEDISSYLKLSIDNDGRLAYIVLLSACDNDERLIDPYIELRRGDREAELSFNWKCFSQRNINVSECYQNLENKEGLPIIKVRDFGESSDRAEEVPKKLKEIGFRTKDVDVVLYDVLTSYDYDELIKPKGYKSFWYSQNFKASRVAEYVGRTRIMPSDITYGQYYARTFNDVPVNDETIKFFIQDNRNGSGLENMICAFNTLKNTIFVGGHSKGLQICGGNFTFNLPNTGTYAQFGMNLMFVKNTTKNIDGIGYEPDIWVDPVTAQEKILKLCEYYNISNSADFEEMVHSSDLKESQDYEIQLDLGVTRIKPSSFGTAFGFGMCNNKKINVLKDGERFEDFDCYVTDEKIGSAEKTNGSEIVLNAHKAGDTEIVISIDGGNYYFTWHIE